MLQKQNHMKASVIMSTYNSEEWLEKVIWGFSVQTETDFEIIVADDGSNPGTKALLDSLKDLIQIPLVHVWQEDIGFRKSEILNKAIVASNSDYLIFTDGDCIPRKDFVETHLFNRESGHFLSGGYSMLPMKTSKLIGKDDIISQDCFDLKWLMARGLKKSFKNIKFTADVSTAAWLNTVTPTKRTWNGHNASGWKKDIMAINGFNCEMQYGGQDREFGERLNNFGIKGKQIRYSAICIHLDHDRKYANEEGKRRNRLVRNSNKRNRITVVEKGIDSSSSATEIVSGKKVRISVVVSTYNAEEWLEKVLIGYSAQTYKDFEIIIADDGSRSETKALIARYAANYPVPLRHLWHDDLGYRRQEILNVAIIEAAFEYILMTDGDCIPRKDFVEVHARHAEKGKFLSGGYCKLSMKTSKEITKEDIETQRCFDVNWLKKVDKLGFSQMAKLSSDGVLATILDLATPTTPSFNNCNSSGFKSDMIMVNGYDERMKYGGSDREIGERLENAGINGKQIRHKAICLHLDHSRGYKTKDSMSANIAIRNNVKANKITWTPFGIKK